MIKTYVNDEEFTRILETAKSTGLSLSAFTKHICLGHEVKSLEHAHVRYELRKLRGEIGRVGGLFKQLLAHEILDKHHVHRHLAELDVLQRKIKIAVENCS